MTEQDREEELAQLRRIEIASSAEATTLSLLVFVAVPLKHLGGWTVGVQVMGPVHGLAFVAYVWTAVQTITGGHWRRAEAARLLAVAFIPLGGFLNLPFLAGKAAALRRETGVSLAELYPWLKALHVAAALTFVGGVLVVTIMLDALRTARSDPLVKAVRRWDRTVTTPAMLLVWALGLALGLTGHWFGDHWLQAKLVLVLVLSGVHAVQSGRLRRTATQASARTSLAPVVLGAATAIAILAVVKP